jgi:hypothetical protein
MSVDLVLARRVVLWGAFCGLPWRISVCWVAHVNNVKKI